MHDHRQNRQENPHIASLGVGVASVGLSVGVASFLVVCAGFPGWGIVGMFGAILLAMVGLGIHAHATPDSPFHPVHPPHP